jgi:HNH endonuclease
MRAIPFESRLEALESVAALLPWPVPRVRSEAECHELVRLIDAVLVGVARGRGALDVDIGEHLEALARGDGLLRLGYATIGDYARERRGLPASTAQKMVRLARELRTRSLLRAAVRAGEVSVRQAEAVLPVARGEAEAHWVDRARKERVRALKSAVREHTAQECDEEEQWVRVRVDLPPGSRPIIDEAMELGRRILGATSLEGRRAAGMCEEYLGAHAPPDGAEEAARLLSAPAADFEEPIKEWLEKETAQWTFLGQPDPVAASEPLPETETNPYRIDERLGRLTRMRERWDELLGHLAMLLRALKGWQLLGFVSFEHYCTERLGMSAQAVAQRAALEQRLYQLPALQQAMRERRISYEKARLIARYADEESMVGWIERAQKMTCIELRRQLQRMEEAQMCARGEFAVWVPRSLVGVFTLAFAAARKDAGQSLSSGECFARIATHFVETWGPVLTVPDTVKREVLARDNWLCQVPGCSGAAAHVHHIVFRSAGGSDDPSNLVSLCAAHHLHGVHKGYIRVRGTAPDQLEWELGLRV